MCTTTPEFEEALSKVREAEALLQKAVQDRLDGQAALDKLSEQFAELADLPSKLAEHHAEMIRIGQPGAGPPASLKQARKRQGELQDEYAIATRAMDSLDKSVTQATERRDYCLQVLKFAAHNIIALKLQKRRQELDGLAAQMGAIRDELIAYHMAFNEARGAFFERPTNIVPLAEVHEPPSNHERQRALVAEFRAELTELTKYG